MSTRLNVSLPEEIVSAMDREVRQRERSKFIAEAIRNLLRQRREERLAKEYQDAARETAQASLDLEATTGDGID